MSRNCQKLSISKNSRQILEHKYWWLLTSKKIIFWSGYQIKKTTFIVNIFNVEQSKKSLFSENVPLLWWFWLKLSYEILLMNITCLTQKIHNSHHTTEHHQRLLFLKRVKVALCFRFKLHYRYTVWSLSVHVGRKVR